MRSTTPCLALALLVSLPGVQSSARAGAAVYTYPALQDIPRGGKQKDTGSGFLQFPRAAVCSSDDDAGPWLSWRGTRILLLLEAMGFLVDSWQAHCRDSDSHREQLYAFATLMCAAGLGIGISFDLALNEVRSHLGDGPLGSYIALLVVFFLFHSYAALEGSNIYSRISKKSTISMVTSNHLPKGGFLVGIAIAPVLCLSCVFLRVLASVLAPVLLSGLEVLGTVLISGFVFLGELASAFVAFIAKNLA